MANLIYMGNFSSLNVDPTESNYNAENAALLNGVSADHTTLQIVNASITDGGDGAVNDDDYGTSDCIYYNTGSGATAAVNDTSLQANVTVTLQDGSTVTVEAVVMQMTNGDLFVSDLLNVGRLDNLQISNIEINSITGSNYSGWYSNQSVDNSTIVAQDTATENGGVVDGTNDADVIDANYDGDSEGDMIDAGDAILAGEEPQDDIVDALGGNDTISSGAGNDDVYAGSGADSVDGGTGDDLIFGDSNYGGGDTGTGTTVATDVELTGASGSFAAGTETVNYTVTATGGNLDSHGGYGDQDGSNYWLGNSGDDAETYTCAFTETVSEMTMRINATSGNDNLDFIINGVDVSLNDLIVSGDVTVVTQGDPFINAAGDLIAGANAAATASTTLQFNMPIDTIAIAHTGTHNGSLIEVNVNEVQLGGGSTGTTGASGTDTGEDGDDRIVGGEGNDFIEDGVGNDTIHAGNDPELGLDFLNIEDDGTNALGPDLRPDNGKDTVSGGDGNDLITGADDDDVLSGDAGNDTIDGDIDDDSIDGGTGDDLLIGGQGNDTLIGGAGNDVLGGGSGSDDLSGGDDRDRFVDVTAGDTIDGGEGGDDFDTLDLTNSAGADQEVNVVYDVTNSENGIVEYKDQDGNVVDTLTFTNIESIIPCFTPGTLIATAKGERRVEDLAEGDRVITRDNGIQTIRWAGAREMTGAEFEQTAHLKPVLIQQGALGGGLPERDMMVSPQHRMLVANDKTALYFEEREVLVAAKFLTDLEGIDVVDVSSTTYIHIMFDQHEVVLSDGTWTESFQPGDQTLAGVSDASRDEILELFPELATREGVDAYASARRSLKKHEASLLTK